MLGCLTAPAMYRTQPAFTTVRLPAFCPAPHHLQAGIYINDNDETMILLPSTALRLPCVPLCTCLLSCLAPATYLTGPASCICNTPYLHLRFTTLHVQAGIYKSEAAMLELHEQQKQKAGQGGGQSTEGFVPPQLRRGQSKQSQQ
jgi:hypothetical protein